MQRRDTRGALSAQVHGSCWLKSSPRCSSCNLCTTGCQLLRPSGSAGASYAAAYLAHQRAHTHEQAPTAHAAGTHGCMSERTAAHSHKHQSHVQAHTQMPSHTNRNTPTHTHPHRHTHSSAGPPALLRRPTPAAHPARIPTAGTIDPQPARVQAGALREVLAAEEPRRVQGLREHLRPAHRTPSRGRAQVGRKDTYKQLHTHTRTDTPGRPRACSHAPTHAGQGRSARVAPVHEGPRVLRTDGGAAMAIAGALGPSPCPSPRPRPCPRLPGRAHGKPECPPLPPRVRGRARVRGRGRGRACRGAGPLTSCPRAAAPLARPAWRSLAHSGRTCGQQTATSREAKRGQAQPQTHKHKHTHTHTRTRTQRNHTDTKASASTYGRPNGPHAAGERQSASKTHTVNTNTRTHTHTHRHARPAARLLARTDARTHAGTHARMHARTPARTHTYTRALAHARTHARSSELLPRWRGRHGDRWRTQAGRAGSRRPRPGRRSVAKHSRRRTSTNIHTHTHEHAHKETTQTQRPPRAPTAGPTDPIPRAGASRPQRHTQTRTHAHTHTHAQTRPAGRTLN